MMTEKTSLLKPFQYERRIYHRNTDAAGVVYYGDYFIFFEEARAEWLRSYGFNQAVILNEFNTHILVKAVREMTFIRPARMDDIIHIECKLLSMSKIVFTIEQIARNQNGEDLVTAKIDLLSVDATSNRPKRSPAPLLERLAQEQ